METLNLKLTDHPLRYQTDYSLSIDIPKASLPALTPKWHPFKVCPPGQKPIFTREIHTQEGIADRMRTAAFAELQAYHAFYWGAEVFKENAPTGLCGLYKQIAEQEKTHLELLLGRMRDLGMDPAEREVSDSLWHSLVKCQSMKEFCIYMASAEERGRKAGFRFEQELRKTDPVSAEIFGKIAKDEAVHIEIAEHYFKEEVRLKTGQKSGQQ